MMQVSGGIGGRINACMSIKDCIITVLVCTLLSWKEVKKYKCHSMSDKIMVNDLFSVPNWSKHLDAHLKIERLVEIVNQNVPIFHRLTSILHRTNR